MTRSDLEKMPGISGACGYLAHEPAARCRDADRNKNGESGEVRDYPGCAARAPEIPGIR